MFIDQSVDQELESLKGELTKLGLPQPDQETAQREGLRAYQNILFSAQKLQTYGVEPKTAFSEFQGFLERVKTDPQLAPFKQYIEKTRTIRSVNFFYFVSGCRAGIFYEDFVKTGNVESLQAAHFELNAVGLYPRPENPEKLMKNATPLHSLLVQTGIVKPNEQDRERQILTNYRISPAALKEGVKPFQTLDTFKRMQANTEVTHLKDTQPTINVKRA